MGNEPEIRWGRCLPKREIYFLNSTDYALRISRLVWPTRAAKMGLKTIELAALAKENKKGSDGRYGPRRHKQGKYSPMLHEAENGASQMGRTRGKKAERQIGGLAERPKQKAVFFIIIFLIVLVLTFRAFSPFGRRAAMVWGCSVQVPLVPAGAANATKVEDVVHFPSAPPRQADKYGVSTE